MEEMCDLVIDLSGLACPYSLLELGAAIQEMKPGATAAILCDRESAVDELVHWCRSTGNEVVSVEKSGGRDGDFKARLVMRKA